MKESKWRNVYPKNIKWPVEHLGEEADQGQLEAGLCVRVHAVVRLHYQVPSDDKSFRIVNTEYIGRFLRPRYFIW